MRIKQRSAAAPSGVRRWWLLAFFLTWTAGVAVAVMWLIGDAANLGNTVIQLGSGESKTWGTRIRETITLARLNFPWALAWLFLTPYALWLGVRFSFDAAQWRSRLPVLLVGGAAFVGVSQWLALRLVAGQRVIVMVKYSANASVGGVSIQGEWAGGQVSDDRTGRRTASNRVSRIAIAGGATFPGPPEDWRLAVGDLPGTNLPDAFVRDTLKDLAPTPGHASRWSALLDGLAFIALVGLAHAGVFHRRYREREQQAAVLESRLHEARLSALQAQLQPHFLFNTLNGIATLLRRDPATAGEMLQALSDLLRIAFSTSERQEIPLREELAFLSRYLAIQRMRFGERLNVVEEIEPATLDCFVPALLLQPIVENAIRHGLEPSGRPGTLRLVASREGDRLRLAVEDDGVGLVTGAAREGAGVGLANVRERLTTLYGGAQEFQLSERTAGGVVVVIRLPARCETPAEPAKEALTR